MEKLNRIGEKHITNEGYEVEIIECYNSTKFNIKFTDGVLIENLEYATIKKGAIKNPYHRSVCGIGYFGIGIYNSKDNKKCYTMWNNLIQRCYNFKRQKTVASTYKDCIVCEEWKCFQNFAKWYEDNWKPYMKDWQLDKDILIKGNKIYSPETCCFIPTKINYLFIKCDKHRGKHPLGVHCISSLKYKSQFSTEKGIVRLGVFNTPEEAFQAYKIAKEQYIKEVADKWKDLVSSKVHNAMYNYQVEITD